MPFLFGNLGRFRPSSTGEDMLDGSFPDDLHLHVLSLLDAGSLSRCAAVSRDLRRLATTRQLWLRLLVQRAADARGWAVCERQLDGVSRAGVMAALGGAGCITVLAPPAASRAAP